MTMIIMTMTMIIMTMIKIMTMMLFMMIMTVITMMMQEEKCCETCERRKAFPRALSKYDGIFFSFNSFLASITSSNSRWKRSQSALHRFGCGVGGGLGRGTAVTFS